MVNTKLEFCVASWFKVKENFMLSTTFVNYQLVYVIMLHNVILSAGIAEQITFISFARV